MGSGKSYLGNLLVKELNIQIIDTDKLIEMQENKPIFEIFKEKGERYFRQKEKQVLQDLVYTNEDALIGKIIVTGGGLPLKRANQKLLKLLNPFYICLNPPFEVILTRIKGSKRPLIYRKSRKTIFNLWIERYEIYQRLADITISETDTEEMFKTLNQRVGMLIINWERRHLACNPLENH